MDNRVSGKQKTVYFISGNSQVYNGMPQGSSLGLLIFIYSLNDLIALKIIMIADDAVVTNGDRSQCKVFTVL